MIIPHDSMQCNTLFFSLTCSKASCYNHQQRKHMKEYIMPMPYFKIDNDIFSLRLDPYEFQVYAYLVSCAGKKGECWPSTNTIARALGMSQSTVIDKIDLLVRRQLIDKRMTTRHSKSGEASTGNNHYHIRSVTEAVLAHERFVGVSWWTGGYFDRRRGYRRNN